MFTYSSNIKKISQNFQNLRIPPRNHVDVNSGHFFIKLKLNSATFGKFTDTWLLDKRQKAILQIVFPRRACINGMVRH